MHWLQDRIPPTRRWEGCWVMSKVKCLGCGVTLESTYRHDFQQCKCSNETFVDGGNDYCRYGGKSTKLIQVLK